MLQRATLGIALSEALTGIHAVLAQTTRRPIRRDTHGSARSFRLA